MKKDGTFKLQDRKSSELRSMYDKLLNLQKKTRELLSQSNQRLEQTIAPTATYIPSYEPIYNNSVYDLK